MRGEYDLAHAATSLACGSSPHAWGIRGCAKQARPRPTVHPHMRGEYWDIECPTGGEYGSSPHAWGIPNIATSTCAGLRFIPTCVGNTLLSLFHLFVFSVHPHMRGEYESRFFLTCLYCGSSPHAWGILVPVWKMCPFRRFIPTCVGNTTAQRSSLSLPTVHPHMRGEYLTI